MLRISKLILLNYLNYLNYSIFLIMIILTSMVRQFLGSVISLQTFWGIFLQLILSGTVGVATYAISTHLLKSPENKIIIDSFLKKFLYPTK